jgi:hypothetical protein
MPAIPATLPVAATQCTAPFGKAPWTKVALLPVEDPVEMDTVRSVVTATKTVKVNKEVFRCFDQRGADLVLAAIYDIELYTEILRECCRRYFWPRHSGRRLTGSLLRQGRGQGSASCWAAASAEHGALVHAAGGDPRKAAGAGVWAVERDGAAVRDAAGAWS